MRRAPNRFRSGELETIVLAKVVENPGMYGSALSDLIFPDPRSGGCHNRIIVLDRVKALERKGHVRRERTMVPSPHGSRIAFLIYPTDTGVARGATA